MAFSHIVIVAYLCGATVAASRAADRDVSALEAAGFPVPPDDASQRARWLRIATVVGVLSALVLTQRSPGFEGFFAAASWGPETSWHRILGLALGVLTARLVFTVSLDALRFWRVADARSNVDLLDLASLRPFARHGQTNALLFLGYLSAYSLFLVDLRYLAIFVQVSLSAVAGAAIAFALPMWGARRLVQRSKARELDEIRERMRSSRQALSDGAPADARDRLDELVAWEARVESVREWPFDSGVLLRVAAYLGIPLLSWGGAAPVERWIDAWLG